ncbi:MAG TPA: LysM domain-containing protein [Acidimicrobiales bacterium]|jgi:predicted Zn-dependent protease|nr:LysM domain-containing protein [Acidimicrobiales bacterium]
MAAIVQAPNHQGPLARPSSRPTLRVIEGGRSPRLQRVYRRRRGVTLALGVVAVALLTFGALRAASALAGVWSPTAGVAPAAVTPAASRVVVVQPGDTLWSIAAQLHPSGDIRAVVDRLARAHGPGPLQPGERITIAG